MLSKKRIFWYFIVPVWLFLLFKLIIPFLLYNNLNIQDMIGHYFSAWYTKEYLWPHIIGWNPFHYFGFPQNQFYPPLFTMLTVILGFLLPLKLAFKLVLSMALLATPLSFYYFCRKMGFQELKAGVGMLGMTSAMFFLKGYAGGTINSTFNAGLVTTALSLPLMFFYLGKLNDSFKGGGYVWPSVLMALVVLSHMFTAIITSILSLCFLIAGINKRRLIFYAKHVLLTFLLSAFWIVPMISKLGYSGTIYLGPRMSLFWLYYAVFFIFAAFSVFYSKNIRQVSLGFILLLAIFISGNFIQIPFHFYRMQLFIVILAVFLCVNMLNKKASYALASVLFILLIVLNSGGIYVEGLKDITIKDFGKVDGRVLVLNHADFSIGWHTLPYKVLMKTGNPIIQGLNIDSAENGFLVGDFMKMIDPQAYIMYSDQFPMFKYNKNRSLLPRQLSLLNINYIVAQNLSFGKRMDEVYDGYYLYKVSNSSFAEVLDYRPVVVKENFKDEAFRWFFEDCGRILVDDDVPGYAGTGNEKVEVVEYKPGLIRLRVDSGKDVPVLVKESYYPDWKAYVNGKETRIYRASPGFMLVYGYKNITLLF